MTTEAATSADFNDTFNAAISLAGVGMAQNAYQTLQANNAFENKDFLVADEFTDSNGTNNTLTSATSYYKTPEYILSNTETLFQNPTLNVNNSSGVLNYDLTVNKTGFISKVTIQNDGANSGIINLTVYIKDSSGTTIASKTQNVSWFGSNTYSYSFTQADYSRLLSPTEVVSVSTDLSYVRTLTGYSQSNAYYTITSQSMNAFSTNTVIPIEFKEVVFDTSSTLVIGTSTKTLDGTENAVVVYADKTTPTNTTMTVDISDGTTTLSAQALNSVLDVSSLSTGTLKLTFNLATTDTTVTPTLKGYGVYIK